MRQQHVTHAPGTFARCRGCRREPMHIVCFGNSTRDQALTPGTGPAERHQLECNRCRHVTARHPTLDAARAEWNTTFAQAPTPSAMRVVPRNSPARSHAQ